MLTPRRANDRGEVDLGWLHSRHTFSFGSYYDPQHMGFGPLRVVNEDRVKPSKGFAPHDHKDMEIVSYVVKGALEHKDSMGNGSVIRRGDVQRMTAGVGVRHSEFNHSGDEDVHFLQIWIEPDTLGLNAGYEEKHFSSGTKRNQLRLVASRDGRDGSIVIHRDVDLFASLLDGGKSVSHGFANGRKGWLQVVAGTIAVNGETLDAGDGLAITDLARIDIEATTDSEFLLFDME